VNAGRLPGLQQGTIVALKNTPDHRASGLASSSIKRLRELGWAVLLTGIISIKDYIMHLFMKSVKLRV